MEPDRTQDKAQGALIQGAGPIAEFLFGDAKLRGRVYHMAQMKRDGRCGVPIFSIGSTLAARPDALMAWIQEQEAA